MYSQVKGTSNIYIWQKFPCTAELRVNCSSAKHMRMNIRTSTIIIQKGSACAAIFLWEARLKESRILLHHHIPECIIKYWGESLNDKPKNCTFQCAKKCQELISLNPFPTFQVSLDNKWTRDVPCATELNKLFPFYYSVCPLYYLHFQPRKYWTYQRLTAIRASKPNLIMAAEQRKLGIGEKLLTWIDVCKLNVTSSMISRSTKRANAHIICHARTFRLWIWKE